MNKPMQLTEKDLHFLVENAVQAYLTENGMDEGLWNQLKTGANTMFQKNTSGQPMGIKNRFQRAKSNFQTQGNLDNLSSLKQQLEQYIDSGQLNPQMTIAQLVGGKYNNNKFGRLTGQMGNMKSQISRRGGQAN